MFAELKALLGLDAGKFNSEVKNAGNNVDKFGKGLSQVKGLIVGAFSVGAIVAFGRQLLKVADDLQTTATTFDLTIESVIALKTVMAESGIKTDSFLRILGKLKSTQGEVVNGVKTYTDAIESLNISQEKFVDLPVNELLEVLAKKYIEAGASAEAYNAISKIFGERIGVNLIEVFKRIDKESLSAIEARTKAAAEGMKTLAAASDTLERAGNKITLWAANMVRWLEKYGKWLLVVAEREEKISEGGETMRLRRRRRAGIKMPEEEEKVSADVLALRARKEEELAKKRKETEEWIAEVQEETAAKRMAALIKEHEAEEKFYKKKEELEKDIAEDRADILAGKGIEAPGMGRVDVLQAIGGIVGGVVSGDQAARRAERQEKIQEALKKLSEEANKKLDKISEGIAEIVVAE